MTTICLNMIVKNESKIMPRLIQSVGPYMDYYVIVDTGSTDGTQELIKREFDKFGVKGEIHDIPWQSFGYNRTQAVQLANKKADYILFMDADMELEVKDRDFKSKLSHPVYHILQGHRNKRSTYPNVRLVKGTIPAKYIMRTHEYLDTGNNQAILTDMVYIVDHYDGANRPEKYVRDIKLLGLDYNEGIHVDRCCFYLGNSYYELGNITRDNGNYKKAIKWYEKRVKCGGWQEECYMSEYRICLCRHEMGEDVRNDMLKCYIKYPHRLEPIHWLVKYYFDKKEWFECTKLKTMYKHVMPYSGALFCDNYVYTSDIRMNIGLAYYNLERFSEAREQWEAILKECQDPETLDLVKKNLLFVDKYIGLKKIATDCRNNRQYQECYDIACHGEKYSVDKQSFWFEKSVVAYYVGKKTEGMKACESILKDTTDQTVFGLTMNNQLFYLEKLPCKVEKLDVLQQIGLPENEWNMYNPSIIQVGNDEIMNVRMVNFKITQDVRFLSKVNGEVFSKENPCKTRNFLFRNGKLWKEIIESREFQGRKTGHYICGIEDLRLFEKDGKIHGIGNSAEIDMLPVMCIIDEDGNVQVLDSDRKICEKNWCPILDTVWFVYGYHPFTIVDSKKNHKIYKTPKIMSQFRGSTQYIKVGHTYYGIVHDVRIGDGRRKYLHRFLQLDSDMKPLGYTQPFYMFEVGIEYICGMIYKDGKFIFTMSKHDTEIYKIEVDKEWVDLNLLQI